VPTPCVVSTTTVSLSANGAPATLQADVRVSSAIPNRLAIATDGLYVRDVNGRVLISPNQSGIVTGTPTVIVWNAIRFSSAGFLNASTINAGVNTIPAPLSGIWRIGYGFTTDAVTTAGADFRADLRIAGGIISHAIANNQKTGDTPIASAMTDWFLNAGDDVQVFFTHTDSVNRTLLTSEETYLSMSYVGPGT
jgi:hypothetical protein